MVSFINPFTQSVINMSYNSYLRKKIHNSNNPNN